MTPPATRRQFLAAAGAAAAAAAGPAAEAADRPIPLGFVGVGNRGSVLLKAALTVPGLEVAAVCDVDPARAARAAKVVTDAGRPAPLATADWAAVLAHKGVAAVVSALPIDLHARNYLDTIAAGKDLYGEKPLCLTAAECDAVAKAAGGSDRVVQIGFQRRANPFFVEAVRLVHGGELGDPVEGRIAWSNAWGPLGDWFGKRARSGDWMLEQACHNWDVLNWALKGLPVRAMGMGRGGLFKDFQPDRDVTDYYSALVEYPNGVIVNIFHSWVAPGQGGKSAFNFEYTHLLGTRAGVDFNTGTVSYRKELNRPDRKIERKPEAADSTRQALEAFAAAVRARGTPVATVAHGRDAALACLLVRKAVDERRPVAMTELLAAG